MASSDKEDFISKTSKYCSCTSFGTSKCDGNTCNENEESYFSPSQKFDHRAINDMQHLHQESPKSKDFEVTNDKEEYDGDQYVQQFNNIENTQNLGPSGGFDYNLNYWDDNFPLNEDFQVTDDEDFPPSENFQSTNEDDEEFPSSGDFKSSEDDYVNGGHSFPSGEFKGSNVDDDDFPPSEDFQRTNEDDKDFPPSGDFQGTNEDDEEFMSSGDFKSSEDDYVNSGHFFPSEEFNCMLMIMIFIQVRIFKVPTRMM
jgi:hypothetical protein